MSTAEDKKKKGEEEGKTTDTPGAGLDVPRDENTGPVLNEMIKQFGQDALANKKGGNLALSPNSDSDDDEPHEGESPEDAKKRR